MFEKKLNDMLDSIERQRKMYARGEELLSGLGLRGLEPLVQYTFIWQDSHWETDKSNPDFPTLDRVFLYHDDGKPFVYICLMIRWENKESAREIILRDSTVDRWEKSSSLSEGRSDRPHYYVEEWRWKDGEYRTGKDEIEIGFYRPVKVGDVINGCAVEQQTREVIDVTLKCSLGER